MRGSVAASTVGHYFDYLLFCFVTDSYDWLTIWLPHGPSHESACSPFAACFIHICRWRMICILQSQNKDPTMNIRTCVQNMLTCTNILDFTLTAWLIKYDKHSSPHSFDLSHGARYTIVRRNQRARMRILKMPARTDSRAAHCNLTGKDGDTTSRCLSWAVLTSALRGMFFHDLHNQLLTSFPQNSTFTAFGNRTLLLPMKSEICLNYHTRNSV
jgi:hypothetical protein